LGAQPKGLWLKSTTNKEGKRFMEFMNIGGSVLRSSRIGLSTWAMGGWMWGGTDEDESIRTIHAALDKGIILIDTAPVYGFGHSEEIVGKAIEKWGRRDQVLIATKVGLDWREDVVFRNASAKRINKEIEDSLRRLKTSYIDLYQVHWPDPLVRIEETAAAMRRLYESGKIRAIGVSNFSPEQMDAFRAVAPCTRTSLRTICSSAKSRRRSPPHSPQPHRYAGIRRTVPRSAERKDASG
jgi:aryl-alcohol dehydrogenase-like predicted oxidoreductase